MELNTQELAYIGDAIYEVYIRKYLLNSGIRKVNNLQKEAKKYVSAISQAKYLKLLIDVNFFDDIEHDMLKHYRNVKVASKPKNTDILTYKYATALEAIIGYYYLNNSNERIKKIMKKITEEF